MVTSTRIYRNSKDQSPLRCLHFLIVHASEPFKDPVVNSIDNCSTAAQRSQRDEKLRSVAERLLRPDCLPSGSERVLE
jgi:hypothetical protein